VVARTYSFDFFLPAISTTEKTQTKEVKILQFVYLEIRKTRKKIVGNAEITVEATVFSEASFVQVFELNSLTLA
jgi:hypothetical protein